MVRHVTAPVFVQDPYIIYFCWKQNCKWIFIPADFVIFKFLAMIIEFV